MRVPAASKFLLSNFFVRWKMLSMAIIVNLFNA